MKSNSVIEFENRLISEWLPDFCNAPHRQFSMEGYDNKNISKLSEHDAFWFMRAIDLNIVSQSDGFFIAPLSKAKEQIFWTGHQSSGLMPITLWLEPVITIGGLAKLHCIYEWPIDKLGAQSKTWAFDLVGYGDDPEQEILACEVKKSEKEIDDLLMLMNKYSNSPPLEEIPAKGKERNAYKKIIGIRRTWPSIFWALGPNNYEKSFAIERINEHEFKFNEAHNDILKYKDA